MNNSSFDAERALAYQEAQTVGWKAADRDAIARRAAQRKARDPRILWSFYSPSAAEVAAVEAAEQVEQQQSHSSKGT